MGKFDRDIDAALTNDEPIPKEAVLRWIGAASDLPALSKLYRLTGESYYRIQPDLGSELTCGLIQRYLLECIRQNVKDEKIQGRWEAAQTLHAWFCRLAEMEGRSEILQGAAQTVTELYLASGEEIRNAIEQGFLEHALEMATLRPYFEYWSSDSRLRAAWGRALEWGKAHPDYTWGLLQTLRGTEK